MAPPGPTDGTSIRAHILANPERLDDVAVVERFLTEAVVRLGMRALAPPAVYDVCARIRELGGEAWEDEGGVSGCVILSTSHIAIHTWPKRKRAVIDAWSCRIFEPRVLRMLAADVFYAEAVTIHDTTGTLKAWG